MHDYFDGRYSSAIQNLDRAIAADPNNATAYYYRGLARFASGDEPSARMDFEKGSALEYTHGGNVGRALERVQGPVRQVLESYRTQGQHWASVSCVLSVLKESDQFRKMQKDRPPLASDLYAWFHKVISKLPERSLQSLLMGGLRGVACFPDRSTMYQEIEKYPYLKETPSFMGCYDPVRRLIWCYVDGPGGTRGGGVLAHELGHAIDATGGFSKSQEWVNAWSSEIKQRETISDEERRRLERERFGDTPSDQIDVNKWMDFNEAMEKREFPLSRRAAPNPEEGFAEFMRAVSLADASGRRDLKQRFPKCWSFFEGKGILPLS